MKILLAVPDRDLLSGLKSYLEVSGYDVFTAFDGIQAVENTVKEKFDAAVIDFDLPRIKAAELIKLFDEKETPTVVLTKGRISAKLLCGSVIASSYLTYPFLPEELIKRIEAVVNTAHKFEAIRVGDCVIDPAHFSMSGKIRLTEEEIHVLSDIAAGITPGERRADIFIDSLNRKLNSVNSLYRISFIQNEGYRLVTKNE